MAEEVKRFRDPIHGFVGVTAQELAAIDSSFFQRLRGISQLALTELVYHGARHTRFEHSIGAMHVAGAFSEAADKEDNTIVRLAALLHDLGHGPFSHVLDGVMRTRVGRAMHEAIGRAVVTSGKYLDCFDDGEQAAKVADLFDPPKGRRSVSQDIVSGPTDADKCDYLLRDSHYCGVQYGRFDLARVIETARSVGGSVSPQLGFEEGGLDAVEGLLYARRSMFRQVYRQKTRRATDLMLIRAIDQAIQAGDEEVSRLIPPQDGDGNPVIDDGFMDGYLALDDDIVRRHLEAREDSSGELARALRSRELVHEVCQLGVEELKYRKGSPWVARLLDSRTVDPETLGRIEESIAADLGCGPHWVFVTIESEKNPLYRPPGWYEQPGDIIIEREGLGEERFQELSELWRPGIEPDIVYVSLFTHRDEAGREKFRDFGRREWGDYLITMLESEVSG